MDISFYKPDNSLLATYNLTQLQGDISFNFNFQISLIAVLQSGAINTPTGLFLGDSANGYTLDSGGGSINFSDNNNFIDFDSGGTVTASV